MLHALVLLATRVLPASPNFGQAKHCQEGPAATFRPKGVCSPMHTGLFIFNGPSQYLSPFSSWRPKSKNFQFSRISIVTCKNFCRPAAHSILMPPTIHIASLNRYTTKLSGVPQKLTWTTPRAVLELNGQLSSLDVQQGNG